MPDTTEEGVDYTNIFQNAFSKSNHEERLRKERRANRTPAERNRGGKGGATRSAQINFRATPRTKKLLDLIAKKAGRSAGDLLEEAIERLAKTHEVGGGNA